MEINIYQALLEQVTYSPCAMVSFYFGMSLLEGKTVEEAKKEVEKKFLPTYKVQNLMIFVNGDQNIIVLVRRH